jgi:copper chaperone
MSTNTNTNSTADRTTSTYTVTGMTCGHCVASVTDEVSKVDGVTDVEVDLASGQVTVTSDGPLDAAAVAAAVDDAGYAVTP